MTGQLPPQFFTKFFVILTFKPEEAAAFKAKLDNLAQRKFLQAQLDVLPQNEQQVFTDILNQDGVSAETINDFLESRFDDSLRQSLWQDSLLFVWQEVLDRVKDTASTKQKEQIKELVQQYLISD